MIEKPMIRNGAGYAFITFEGQRIGYHVYRWILHNKRWPEGIIDHIDGNIENDDPSNLRETTYQKNNWNSRIKKNNTSGVKCVYWHEQRNKWAVQIRVTGKRMSFGLYEDLELAELIANEAREKYHGEFARNA